MKLIISVQSESWIPAVVNVTLLEKFWRNDQDYYKRYGFPPYHKWLGFDGYKRPNLFKVGVCYVSRIELFEYKLTFNNGRHRTRWLLENNAKEIPIAIHKNCFEIALKSGLVIKELANRSAFSLGFEVTEVDFED